MQIILFLLKPWLVTHNSGNTNLWNVLIAQWRMLYSFRFKVITIVCGLQFSWPSRNNRFDESSSIWVIESPECNLIAARSRQSIGFPKYREIYGSMYKLNTYCQLEKRILALIWDFCMCKFPVVEKSDIPFHTVRGFVVW